MNRPKRFICFSLIIELSFLHKFNSSMSSLLGAFDSFKSFLSSPTPPLPLPRGEYSTNIWGRRWAAEGFKPWPYLGQKIPKIRTLFRTTPSTLLPCLGQKTKCAPSLFWHSRNGANLRSLIVILYLEYKQNSSSEVSWSIVQAGRPRRYYIPCLGQRGQNQYPGYRYIPV